MLINIELTKEISGKDLLIMDCYSFDQKEFESVRSVIRHSMAKIKSDDLPKDRHGRIGIRFLLLGNDIKKFGDFLKVKFSRKKDDPVTFLDGGESFRCERISFLDNSYGCETIYAVDNDAAAVKCSMLANKKGWFGGITKRGRCDN